MVVDDNLTNRRILKKLLENWGMTPTLASSGQEALRILASHAAPPFAFILLDYHMPEMDGITVAQEIKNRPELGTATVLMLSSGGGPGEAAEAREAGIATLFSSPSSSLNCWPRF